MKFTKCLLGITIYACSSMSPAAAQSCSATLNNINSWFLNGGSGPGLLNFVATTMNSNRADGGYVSYGEGQNGTGGQLSYHAVQKIGAYTYPAYIEGTLAQYFSDRRYQPPNAGYAWAPFNPNSTDRLGVRIFLEDGITFGIRQGEVVLIGYSWGGGTTTFQGRCNEGMLYGFTPLAPTNVWTLFTFSLNTRSEIFQ
jgi:hypothetical protein